MVDLQYSVDIFEVNMLLFEVIFICLLLPQSPVIFMCLSADHQVFTFFS